MDSKKKDLKEETKNEHTQEEDDPYLIGLHQRYLEMRNQRKQAEKNSDILLTRLNLLRKEENKVILYQYT